jgi:hypothetical protein
MRLSNLIPVLALFGYSFDTNALDHCMSINNIPVFNQNRDMVGLHYDFCPDGDDLISAVADRALLETVFGIEFISTKVVKTGGTYSRDRGYYKSSIEILNTLWNDVGNVFHVKGSSSDPDSDAVKYETKMYLDTISNGGFVFLKEGGQADYTAIVVKEMEKMIPGSGKCLVVVQHSTTNESNYGAGVLSYMKKHTTYIKIPDGNQFLRKDDWKLDGLSFDRYATESRLDCVWSSVFKEFKKQKTFCKKYSGKRVDVSKCVDFSDTFELLWILGIDNQQRRTNIRQFVELYIQPVNESDKFKCESIQTAIPTTMSNNRTLTEKKPTTVMIVDDTLITSSFQTTVITNEILITSSLPTELIVNESDRKDHSHCLIIPSIIIASFVLSLIVF